MKKLLNKLKFHLFPATIPEKPITVVVASYNNKQWYKKNLDSIFSQKYTNYKVIYLDDCSTYGTASLVEEYAKTQSHRFTLIKNKENMGATYNRYTGSMQADKESIVIIIDGDDWLSNNKVFQFINKIYSISNTWVTYGQFRRYPTGEVGHCKKLDQNMNFRSIDQWYASHLRTYYAWLFHQINPTDLTYKDKFLSLSGDAAEMLPMLEMARGHIKFISKTLYIYNQATELNDFKCYPKEQVEMFEWIKSKPAYKPISRVD